MISNLPAILRTIDCAGNSTDDNSAIAKITAACIAHAAVNGRETWEAIFTELNTMHETQIGEATEWLQDWVDRQREESK